VNFFFKQLNTAFVVAVILSYHPYLTEMDICASQLPLFNQLGSQ